MDMKSYLGDGLYVDYADTMVKLYTHDGYVETNKVWMEPEVLQNFLAWLRKHDIIKIEAIVP